MKALLVIVLFFIHLSITIGASDDQLDSFQSNNLKNCTSLVIYRPQEVDLHHKVFYVSKVFLGNNSYTAQNEVLRQLFDIPCLYRETSYEFDFLYEVKHELQLLRGMAKELDDFIENLNSRKLAQALTCRNQFLQFAAQYQLYGAGYLYHDSEDAYYSIDLLEITQRLVPSLDFNWCKLHPLQSYSLEKKERKYTEMGEEKCEMISEMEDEMEGIPHRPVLGFSFLCKAIKALEIASDLTEFSSTSHLLEIQNIQNASSRFKMIDIYFHINEYIRVTLPLFKQISEFNVSENVNGIPSFIKKIADLLEITRKIPPEFIGLYFNDIKELLQKEVARKNPNNSNVRNLKRKLIHAVIPWSHIRYLGLFSDYLNHPIIHIYDNQILLDALPEIISEFQSLQPLLYRFINEEIKNAFYIDDSTFQDLEMANTPALSTFGNYSSDILYLNKLIYTLSNGSMDLSITLSADALLRIYEIIGEISKNISSHVQCMTNKSFWENAQKIRDKSLKSSSYTQSIKQKLKNENVKQLIQSELQAILNSAKKLLAIFPKKWSEIRIFYNSIILSKTKRFNVWELIKTPESINNSGSNILVDLIKNRTKSNVLISSDIILSPTKKFSVFALKSTKQKEMEDAIKFGFNVLATLAELENLLTKTDITGSHRIDYRIDCGYYIKTPDIYLAAEHYLSIIREDVKKMSNGLRYFKRYDQDHEVIELLSAYTNHILFMSNDLKLSGNEVAHIEDANYSCFFQNEAYHYITYVNLITLLDGSSSRCDCYYCKNTYSPYKSSFKQDFDYFINFLNSMLTGIFKTGN